MLLFWKKIWEVSSLEGCEGELFENGTIEPDLAGARFLQLIYYVEEVVICDERRGLSSLLSLLMSACSKRDIM